MSGVLVSTGYRWCRVGGSTVLHLVPPTILARSRTACSRLAVYDMTLTTPLGLLEELKHCQGCAAMGGRA
jgi:hypothetical protein